MAKWNYTLNQYIKGKVLSEDGEILKPEWFNPAPIYNKRVSWPKQLPEEAYKNLFRNCILLAMTNQARLGHDPFYGANSDIVRFEQEGLEEPSMEEREMIMSGVYNNIKPTGNHFEL